jgi:CRP-like cAMP-binding protein
MNPEKLSVIRQLIFSHIQMSEEEWNNWSRMFEIKVFTKNEVLLKPGDICKSIYFVNSGLLRLFFVDKDGEEHSFHFSMENTFAADYESFLKKSASDYGIQALENTQVICISHKMLDQGYAYLKEGQKLGRILAENYFFLFSNKIKSYYTESPLERYQSLEKFFPGILQRIPQHYIASYLNISSVHLSRLKNA